MYAIKDRLWDYEDELKKELAKQEDLFIQKIPNSPALSSVLKELERFTVEAMPDEKLPLFINRPWIFPENGDYFRMRIAEADYRKEQSKLEAIKSSTDSGNTNNGY